MHASMMMSGLIGALATASVLPNTNVIPKRQDEQTWESDEGGNTRISVSSSTISYGNAPPWHVFDELLRHCSFNGCIGENKMTYESSYVISGRSYSQNIQVSAEATFSDGGPGSREDMIEVAKAVMGGTPYEVTETTYQLGPDCPAVGVPCIPPDTATMDQYNHIQGLIIRYDGPESGDHAFMHLWVTIDEIDLGDGFCSEIMTIGGTVAGLIHGLAGGAFTLASLACDAGSFFA